MEGGAINARDARVRCCGWRGGWGGGGEGGGGGAGGGADGEGGGGALVGDELRAVGVDFDLRGGDDGAVAQLDAEGTAAGGWGFAGGGEVDGFDGVQVDRQRVAGGGLQGDLVLREGGDDASDVVAVGEEDDVFGAVFLGGWAGGAGGDFVAPVEVADVFEGHGEL